MRRTLKRFWFGCAVRRDVVPDYPGGGGPGGGSRGGGIGGTGAGFDSGGGSRGASAGGLGIRAMFLALSTVGLWTDRSRHATEQRLTGSEGTSLPTGRWRRTSRVARPVSSMTQWPYRQGRGRRWTATAAALAYRPTQHPGRGSSAVIDRRLRQIRGRCAEDTGFRSMLSRRWLHDETQRCRWLFNIELSHLAQAAILRR
jgi:hypothetical protein